MTDEQKAQKLLDDLLGDGKIKELLEKRFPYEFAGDQSGIDSINKQIEEEAHKLIEDNGGTLKQA